MADLYWVGGTATWDATAGTKWATTSGGAGGAAIPTAADDVHLDAASGTVTVTVSSSTIARSLDCSGFTGTLSHPNATITLGDSTAGQGNIALQFSSTMTYSPTVSSSSWNFISYSPTVQTIDFAGKNLLGTVTMSGSTVADTGSYKLLSGFRTGSNVNFSRGTIDLNGLKYKAFQFTFGSSAHYTNLKAAGATLTYSSNASNFLFGNGVNIDVDFTNARIICGSSVLFGGPTYNTLLTTGMTVVMQGTAARTISGPTSGLTIGTLIMVTTSSTATIAITTDLTIGTIVRGPAYATSTITVTSGKNLTITDGSLPHGAAGNLLTLKSSVAGTPFTLTSPVPVATDYTSVKDCTGAGAVPHYMGANSTNVSGNTNLLFTRRRPNLVLSRSTGARSTATTRSAAGSRTAV